LRLANLEGRAAFVVDGRVVDAERVTGGRLGADPVELLGSLPDVGDVQVPDDAPRLEDVRLGPPIPRPSKILAVGLNYADHARESGRDLPTRPVIFAKLPSSLAGAHDEIAIPAGRERVDWEAELVAVIGRLGKNVTADEAWDHVAGFMCGQDVSDREEQFRDLKQFTMAKSFDTYSPTGPVLVTPDELPDREDLAIRCLVDGEVVQESRTSELIFSVPQLVEWCSRICTLEPGDLIYTGTPGGVGDGRDPPRYLRPGNVVETEIEGIGTMRNPCVEA
jgi:2,4-didehydro-3-deoxy-L-rhamnonate hydrolase